MKKIALISAIALSSLLFNSAKAQIRVHLGIHFASRPVYVPERVVVAQPAPDEYSEPSNYDGDEDYYYLPEVDAYYSIPEQCYYYNDGGSWVSAAYLPGAYRNYDWRVARRFEVHAHRPFMHNDYYRTRYNGVAFNGHWDRGYSRGYADNSRYNHEQYRRDDHRSDNGGWAGSMRDRFDNRNQHSDSRGHYNQRMDQSRNFERVSAREHFAQNDPQRRSDHRRGRF